MKLIRTVKVGHITNLSDARYCAGMGVHMLGFCVVENRPGFVSPDTFRGLRGWFSGPSVVAEIYGLRDRKNLSEVMHNYLPDFLELGLDDLPFVELPSVDLIVSIQKAPVVKLLDRLSALKNQVAYVLIDADTPAEYIHEIAGYYPVLLNLGGLYTTSLLNLPVKGFALQGSPEEKPGLKQYDALANVLEQLSED